MRWDLYLQGFQIKKEYIKGEENAISDTFSRLCAVSDPNEYVHPIMEADLDTETLHYLSEIEVEVETVAAVAEIKNLLSSSKRGLPGRSTLSHSLRHALAARK